MSLIFGALIAMVCLFIIGGPFLRRKGHFFLDQPDPILEIETQRENIYQELRKLRNDHIIGDVNQVDYEGLLESYRITAARLLQQQAYIEEVDQFIENEIQELRDFGAKSTNTKLCLKCEKLVDIGEEQCGFCGANVAKL
jgi:hypothetical protein